MKLYKIALELNFNLIIVVFAFLLLMDFDRSCANSTGFII